MYRLGIVFFISLSSLTLCSQNYSSAVQQSRIDSLISIGENIFSAEQNIIFKYESNIDSPAASIKENDLVIILKKVDDIFYEVEWDNKIGYIFQLDVAPYNLLSEDHYINKNPLNDINRSVRYDSIKESSTEQEESESLTERGNESFTERSKSMQAVPKDLGCWIQFFASKYSNKKFDMLNDLGTVTATTDLRDKLTRYRLSIVNQKMTCEEVIRELVRRGFAGSFNIYEEEITK